MSGWTRVKLAFAAFFTILFKGRLPQALQQEPPAAPSAPATTGPAVPATGAAQPTGAADDADRALQTLALLQRDGRLVDFLMENLGSYSDAQIGAAARDVHGGCRRVVEKYFTLEEIVAGQEGQPVTLQEVFDPSAIRLLGNVTGQPPFRGTLLHRGWRASRVDLPPLGPAGARRVIAPAEVEVA